MSIYTVAHIVRLYCATAFVGGVSFEILVLSVIHAKRVSRETQREVGRAISYRAVRMMPPMVTALFLSGLVMVFDRCTDILYQPLTSSFGTLLVSKILLVFDVLVHFAVVVVRMRRRTPIVGWSRYIHVVAFTHTLFIVFLVKGVFYFSW